MHDSVLRELRCEPVVPEGTGDVERRTWIVVALTAATMVAEIAVGWWSGSMALLADGWHMGTHAGAIGLAAAAYWYARSRARSRSFAFGAGKVHALAAWTNALLLVAAGAWMVVDGLGRLVWPVEISVAEAFPIAVLGLTVNVVSAWLLRPDDAEHHGHGHDHAHSHDHGGGEDLAHRSAYLHVLMDLMTSVSAIVALGAVWMWNATFLDPLIGVLGALLVLRWGAYLGRDAGRQLIDMAPADDAQDRVRTALESIDDVRVADLHVWELGFGRRACAVSLVSDRPRSAAEYRSIVLGAIAVQHVTVEVHTCPDPCEAA